MSYTEICTRCNGRLEKPKRIYKNGNVCLKCQHSQTNPRTEAVNRLLTKHIQQTRQFTIRIIRNVVVKTPRYKKGSMIPKTLIEYRKDILRKIDDIKTTNTKANSNKNKK